jgi:uncharacterized protein
LKCPSCRKEVNDDVKKCPECGFTLAQVGKKIKNLPRKSGWVMDNADIIDEEYTNQLFETLIRFNKDTGIEFYVVTVPDCEGLSGSEYVFYLLNHYEIGGPDHKGLVLLLSIKEKSVSCEVGYGLENRLTDKAAEYILEKNVAPFCKKKKYGEALYAGVCLFCDILKFGRSRVKRIVRRIIPDFRR